MGNILPTGSRVSENDGSDDNNLKENDVKMENVNEDDSEQIEDNVMSEVSSLRDNFEEQEELENGFHVGDFVWGEEVNSQQWWPGQIYDSLDASDLALKTMQKGKLLVAYFGDGSFGWCNPLELKPFLENFKEFSKMSDSRRFLSAVEEAVREIGVHVEQFLVCDDAALVSSVALNSGIKEGVVVPDVRREVISSLVLENPGVVLDDVKRLAKTVCFSDLLEIEVLKRKISAFYRCKGRFDLAKYDEQQYIIGLEHKEDESCQRSLRKCSGFASKKRKCGDVATTGSTTLRRRRLSEVSKIEHAEEEISNGKSLSSRKRKSKMGLDENDDDGIEKREESNDSNHIEEGEKKDDSGIEIDVDLATPLASICKRLKVDVSSSVKRSNGNGETILQTGKRERKKSKYLSPEYMTDFSCRARKSKIESAESSQIRVAERITTEIAIDFVRSGATSEEMLDLIRAAASSAQYPKDYNTSCDMVREFVSTYRSFNNKIHKRNISDVEKQPEVVDEKEQTRDEPNETDEKQFSGVELFIKTGFGSTLPSKDDLIKIYEKFGALDKERSYIFDNNSCARLAFFNASDGEQAFNKSLEKCPFATTSTVTFKLKYPSSASPEKEEAETRKGLTEIECLKEKLEGIRALIDQSEGKITEELKMKLEDESRNLLDKVRKMIIRSSCS
ncbi:PWWP domain [Arabidopsis thaliana x Arabidopsis arenosa]|uniref:PWWP domain n=1 Tax=Arabidopsis thaliana x Arabidopsis arenosa TaxID=1240361 RepID=A0A8T1ZKN7_9BRAS|nr:PWWP domain [Arabidopsis thaliana x Arabidopsis arenosa]